jgi:hypothetical protein
MNEKKENLNEVLSGLVGAEEAAQMAEDIAAGDAIIEQFDSPVPDAAVVSGIKKQIGSRLWLKKRRRAVRRTSETAVAAVLVVAVLISAVFIQNRQKPIVAYETPIYSEWEQEISGDPEYALLVAQVEDIEASLLSISLDEDDEQDDILFDVEMEILEMEGNIWEG